MPWHQPSSSLIPSSARGQGDEPFWRQDKTSLTRHKDKDKDSTGTMASCGEQGSVPEHQQDPGDHYYQGKKTVTDQQRRQDKEDISGEEIWKKIQDPNWRMLKYDHRIEHKHQYGTGLGGSVQPTKLPCDTQQSRGSRGSRAGPLAPTLFIFDSIQCRKLSQHMNCGTHRSPEARPGQARPDELIWR